MARRDGRVSVEALAAHFGVTHQTIRRDLSDLADAGRLERVHGGAVLPSGTANIGYAERRALHAGAKDRIARACAAQIGDGTSLFLAIGTTCEAVARDLLHKRGLMVLTNNINVANILAGADDCEVVLTGGTLRRADGGLTGALAMASVRQFKVDLAVIGCSAIDPDGDLMDFDLQEVGVSQTVLRQARRRALVADISKLSRSAPARIASLADIDLVITDAALPRGMQAACQDWGTQVLIA